MCVISDSYNCAGEQGNTPTDAEDDIESGDLPEGVEVFRDVVETDGGEYESCIDEGRAMLQLVHDVAPGADLGFYAGSFGLADFAAAVVRLAEEECCDIIVDDLSYYNESPFQDDVLAQAVDKVVAQGVTYLSAAGNENRNSWEGPWFNEDQGFLDFTDGEGGTGVYILRVEIESDDTNVWLYWGNPKQFAPGLPGPKTDLDLFF